jgi:hypothetical protein
MVTRRRGDELQVAAVAGRDFHRAIGNRGQQRRAQGVEGQTGDVDVKLASSSNLFQNFGHSSIIRLRPGQSECG